MTTAPCSKATRVGESVEIRRLKWPSIPHREQKLELIAHDELGHWFDVPPGVDTSSKARWEFSHDHRAVLLIATHG